MNSLPRPRVLVATCANWISLARLPQAIAAGGCEPHVFAPAGDRAALSRRVAVHHLAPKPIGAYVEALKGFIEARGDDFAWIIAADDILVRELAARAEEPWVRRLLPIQPGRLPASFLTGKEEFVAAMESWSLPVPREVAVHGSEDLERGAAELRFPIIVKPADGSGGRGVFRASTPDEAMTRWFAEKRSGVWVAQEFVEGRICLLEFLMRDGELLCWQLSHKCRVHPAPYGPSSARRFLESPLAEACLREFGKQTAYHGLGSFDLILRDDGSLAFIELNARATSGLCLKHQSGADFGAAIRALAEGRGGSFVGPVRDHRERPLFPQDMVRSLETEPFRQVASRVLTPSTWQDAAWRDPGLLRVQLALVLPLLKMRTWMAMKAAMPAWAADAVRLAAGVRTKAPVGGIQGRVK